MFYYATKVNLTSISYILLLFLDLPNLSTFTTGDGSFHSTASLTLSS